MMMFVAEMLTDFTYHLIHVMKEAEDDPSDRNALKEMTQTHFIMILIDIFFGMLHTQFRTYVCMYIHAYPSQWSYMLI